MTTRRAAFCGLVGANRRAPAITGRRKVAAKLGWALACEITGGAKPHKAAPTAAAIRERTTWRENSQYQAVAVQARPPVRMIVHVAVGPKANVTGVSGTARAGSAVLAIRFTPSGAFCRSENSGLRPSATACACAANSHSKRFWSCMLATR
jgi:hypothetical protein